MESKSEEGFMISTLITKLIGLYQIASLHMPKVFGINVYRLFVIIQCIFLFAFICILIVHVIYSRNDINNVTHYLVIVMPYTLSLVQFHCVFVNSYKIWDCIKSTSNHNLAYKHHNMRILQEGKSKSKLYAIVFIVSWTVASGGWWLLPFVLDDYYIKMTTKNGLYQYRFNILNLVLPVTDKFYNDNYMYYYVIEWISTVISSHGTLLFEVLLISLCIVIIHQLKTIQNSFVNFSMAHTLIINNNRIIPSKTIIDMEIINDFKLLIKDHQHIMIILRNVYTIFKTVTLLFIASQSLEIILCWSLLIMNYFNGKPIMYPSNQRTLGTVTLFMIQLFLVCYLFNEINKEKDAMIIALYSCDWTDRSIHFKKLLLLTMHMNNANNLNLRVTTTKIVNLEMYSSIIRMSYSILSVLANYYGNKS